MAQRLTAEGYPDPCGACMATEAPMCFAGTPWCSDTCRKDMESTLEHLKGVVVQRRAAEESREAYMAHVREQPVASEDLRIEVYPPPPKPQPRRGGYW